MALHILQSENEHSHSILKDFAQCRQSPNLDRKKTYWFKPCFMEAVLAAIFFAKGFQEVCLADMSSQAAAAGCQDISMGIITRSSDVSAEVTMSS